MRSAAVYSGTVTPVATSSQRLTVARWHGSRPWSCASGSEHKADAAGEVLEDALRIEARIRRMKTRNCCIESPISL